MEDCAADSYFGEVMCRLRYLVSDFMDKGALSLTVTRWHGVVRSFPFTTLTRSRSEYRIVSSNSF